MQPGRTFGRYRLISHLGEGGMGEVYLAEATGLDGVARKVAIKLVRQLHKRRKKLQSLFVDEAKVSFLLNHPNIVQTYDIGQMEGHTFLVLEYVDGAGLEQVLERLAELAEPMPLPLALYIGSQIARGLDYAHSFADADGQLTPIVHRDISPGNVLISRHGQVKLADFGLAKSALRSVESDHGSVKGKLAYMPPEQLRGGDVDGRADLYALGVLLYEMIAGAHPFGNVHNLGYLDRLALKKPPPPLDRRSAASPHLAELVATCMASAADDRFTSAREVARLLDQHLRDAGGEVSEFELAELMVHLFADGRPRSTLDAAHPFDAVLGRELERAAGDGALSSFFVAEGDKQPPLESRPTRPESPMAIPQSPAESGRGGGLVETIADDGWASEAPTPRRRPVALLVAALLLLVGGGLLAWKLAQDGAVEPAGGGAATAGAATSQDQGVAHARPDLAARRVRPDARARVTKAALVLRPKPAGGRVWIDGKRMGVTPLTLTGLTAKTLVVRLDTRGYERFEQRVTLAPGATLTLEPRLSKRRRRLPIKRPRGSGYLSVNSEPWAVVQIDGKRIRSTPLLRHRLPVGRHRVTLTNSRYGKRTRFVTIRARQETKLSVLFK